MERSKHLDGRNPRHSSLWLEVFVIARVLEKEKYLRQLSFVIICIASLPHSSSHGHIQFSKQSTLPTQQSPTLDFHTVTVMDVQSSTVSLSASPRPSTAVQLPETNAIESKIPHCIARFLEHLHTLRESASFRKGKGVYLTASGKFPTISYTGAPPSEYSILSSPTSSQVSFAETDVLEGFGCSIARQLTPFPFVHPHEKEPSRWIVFRRRFSSRLPWRSSA